MFSKGFFGPKLVQKQTKQPQAYRGPDDADAEGQRGTKQGPLSPSGNRRSREDLRV